MLGFLRRLAALAELRRIHSHPIAAAPRLGRLMFAEVEGGNWRNEIWNFDVGY
jgi:hypothetical protein